MTTWITSDLHLGHVGLVEKGYRPFDSVDAMNETLIANINDRVAPDDRLIILGDLVMGKRLETLPLVARLHGDKVLVLGNHDYPHPAAFSNPEKRAEWRRIYADLAGLRFWPNEGAWHIGKGVVANVCHFPYSGDHTEDERYTEYRPTDDGRFLLHGHVHAAWRVNGRQINVGVDAWDMAPVRLDDLAALIGHLEAPEAAVRVS